jgi:hypothetical protein
MDTGRSLSFASMRQANNRLFNHSVHLSRWARRPPPHRAQAAPYGTLERSKIIALVAKNPPGKLLTEPDGVLRAEDETKAAYWTLGTRSPRLLGRRASRSGAAR